MREGEQGSEIALKYKKNLVLKNENMATWEYTKERSLNVKANYVTG